MMIKYMVRFVVNGDVAQHVSDTATEAGDHRHDIGVVVGFLARVPRSIGGCHAGVLQRSPDLRASRNIDVANSAGMRDSAL